MSILDDVMGEYGFSVPKAAYDKLQEHIAARQPVPAAVKDSLTVGISAEWVLGYLATDAPEESREAIRNAFAEYAALSAAGQPVGQEPVAFANPDDAEDVVGPSRLQSIRDSNGLPGKIIAARYTVPLYASPPVQAADLGQFRALAAKFDGLGDEEVGDAYSGPYYECARQLRALIYSRSAGGQS